MNFIVKQSNYKIENTGSLETNMALQKDGGAQPKPK